MFDEIGSTGSLYLLEGKLQDEDTRDSVFHRSLWNCVSGAQGYCESDLVPKWGGDDAVGIMYKWDTIFDWDDEGEDPLCILELGGIAFTIYEVPIIPS